MMKWFDFGALFTPSEKTKLAGIESAATVDQTNTEIRDAVQAATNSNTFTDADHTKLNGIDTGARDDQTGAEIKTAYQAQANAYTDTKNTKLAGIDTGADVSVLEEVTNVIREKSGGGYDNDLVIGSPQLADDANAAHDARMFFDKSKGAFRVGLAESNQWDNGNVGDQSHAEGKNTYATGAMSHAEGNSTAATAAESHAEGRSTIASGIDSHAEGIGSQATDNFSHAEGYYSKATGDVSHAEGGYSKAYLEYQHTNASGRFSADGDAQSSNVVVRRETTDATQTELTIEGGAPYADSRVILPAGRSWLFIISIIARQTGGGSGTIGHSGGYEIKGVIERTANATRLVGAITNTTIAEDQAAWAVTAVADDTNECLVVKVTGEASKTIHWVANVELVEVG